MQITIAGHQFEVSSPYSAGAIELTEGEAHTLNQTRHENVRNNFAKKVKDGVASGKSVEDLQAEITKYDESYEFGVRGEGTGESRDPVQVEARSLARAAIKAKMKEKGMAAPEAKALAEAVKTLLASEKGQKFIEVARDRVAEKQRIAEQVSAEMGDILANVTPAEVSAPALA